MARISLFTPTMTGDFSGAAAVTSTLDSFTAILDPVGCTKDYRHAEQPDDPDWKNIPVLTTHFYDVDVALGSTKRLVELFEKEIEARHPSLLAIAGSPVSAIIGHDIGMLAADMEEKFDIPCLGIDTTGFGSHADGVFLAMKALVERFGKNGEVRPGTVNILGSLYLDFGTIDICRALEEALGWNGLEVTYAQTSNHTMDSLAAIPQAQVNLALSAAGLQTARWLEKRYGTPYVASVPVTPEDVARVCELLQQAAASGESVDIQLPVADGVESSSQRTLVLGDPVIASSLGSWIAEQGYRGAVEVGCVCNSKPLSLPKGFHVFNGDLELLEHVAQAPYTRVIADPTFDRPQVLQGAQFVPLPQFSISSRHYQDLAYPFARATGERFL